MGLLVFDLYQDRGMKYKGRNFIKYSGLAFTNPAYKGFSSCDEYGLSEYCGGYKKALFLIVDDNTKDAFIGEVKRVEGENGVELFAVVREYDESNLLEMEKIEKNGGNYGKKNY